MNYKELYDKVINLPIGQQETITKINGVEIFIVRPSKVPPRFKEYDLKKNFQIFLKEGDREFKPNHIRVFMDLSLRTKFKPENKLDILQLFDNIFYGKKFEDLLEKLEKVKFEHYLNKDLRITVYLYLLFLIEQDYNYHKQSRFEPKTLFLHGWVRQIICDESRELDNYLMSICNLNPPSGKYTKLDSKIKEVTKKGEKEIIENKEYNENAKQFWYIKN